MVGTSTTARENASVPNYISRTGHFNNQSGGTAPRITSGLPDRQPTVGTATPLTWQMIVGVNVACVNDAGRIPDHLILNVRLSSRLQEFLISNPSSPIVPQREYVKSGMTKEYKKRGGLRAGLKATATVMEYLYLGGLQEIHSSPQMKPFSAKNSAVFVRSEYAALYTQRTEINPLGKSGDSDRAFIVHDYAPLVLNERAFGAIDGLTNAAVVVGA